MKRLTGQFIACLSIFANLVICCDKSYSVHGISTSSEESKKHGLYIGAVTVSPSSFVWQHHDVNVYDCWLERIPVEDCACLCFKLKLDDDPLKEHKTAHKNGDFIKLQQEPEGEQFSHPYYIAFVPNRRLAKYYLGGTYGEYVHVQRLRKPLPENVVLRVGTRNIKKVVTHEATVKPQLSETVLQFELPKDAQ